MHIYFNVVFYERSIIFSSFVSVVHGLVCSTQGPDGSTSQVVEIPNNSYKPITNTVWVRTRLCILHKQCTRLAFASDKDYQLLAHGLWFSPGTPASSTTKTDRHDIAEILLKAALNTKNQSNQSIMSVLNVWLLIIRCIYSS